MSAENYINELRQTRTYKAGLISFQEYAFESKLFGLVRNLKVPHADTNNHIIVLEVRGGQPVFHTALTDRHHAPDLKASDVGKFLFVFIELRAHTLSISSPPTGYQLGDGHEIVVDFEVEYRVNDTERFWTFAKDPLASFESSIIREARNYLNSIDSNYLVSQIADLRQSLEKQVSETGLKIIKPQLEQSIRQINTSSAGIAILNVHARIHFSERLRESMDTVHKTEWQAKTTLSRREITERQIDADKTFTPYSLRQVIMELDTTLLENFHNMPWEKAMYEVHKKLAERKEEFREHKLATQNAEIRQIAERLQLAKDMELDIEYINDLKEMLASKMLKGTEDSNDTGPTTDTAFLKSLFGDSSSKQLGGGTQKSLASGTDDADTE